MKLTGIFAKAGASLKRRLKKKIEDIREERRIRAEKLKKIREAQKKAFWEEYERLAIERARELAREKARKEVSKSRKPFSAASLLGFEISGLKSKTTEDILQPPSSFGSPSDLIFGSSRKRKKK